MKMIEVIKKLAQKITGDRAKAIPSVLRMDGTSFFKDTHIEQVKERCISTVVADDNRQGDILSSFCG